MLAIAAAVVTIVVLNKTYFGPQQPVRDYLSALADGDGSKALGLLDAAVPDADAAVLDGPGLKASQSLLKNIEVSSPQPADGNRVTVTVRYTVAGSAKSTDFLLEPGPTRWLFFGSWKFVPSSLPTLEASVVNEDQATLNGVDVALPGGKNSFAVFYPGAYTAEYRSALFAAPAVTRTVTGPANTTPAVVLATGPTSKLLKQVDGKVRAYLDGCAKQQVLLPTDCPMSNYTDNRVVSAIKWTILSYPHVGISAYGGQWIMAPLSVKAQVEYKEQDLYTGAVSPVKHVDNFGFSAKLSVTDTRVSVTPVVNY